MAKADDTSNTMIWLRDTLALAVRAFGSVVLAKERLREWLASGELPWSCMSWKGLDAERIARLDREQRELIDQKNRGWIVLHIFPSVAYHEGAPQFWRANLNIDWEENEAWEKAAGGARAQGIKASREHLVALLPEEPREHVENPEQTRPAEPELSEPKARPTPTAASKMTQPQSERATRHIPRVFPDGTDAISSEVIRKKLEKDPVLLAELAAQGGKSPSRASIDRALGRRK